VPGGGSSLVHLGQDLDELAESLPGDQATGVRIVQKALEAPLVWIAANAGLEGAIVVSKVRDQKWGHGFNAATLAYGDLVADGVVDPVKVTRYAVANAASIARMVLTTEASVVEKKEEEPEAAGHGHGHGHGHGPGF
jgi:chaperonin GroEL